jgi:hypothetical protein
VLCWFTLIATISKCYPNSLESNLTRLAGDTFPEGEVSLNIAERFVGVPTGALDADEIGFNEVGEEGDRIAVGVDGRGEGVRMVPISKLSFF